MTDDSTKPIEPGAPDPVVPALPAPDPITMPPVARGTMLTTSEVAAILHVGPHRVRKAVHDKKLACVRLSPQLHRYRAEDVEAYIQAQRVEAAAPERETPNDGPKSEA